MTTAEAMVAEVDGWDDDLRVILPTAQYFRYRVLATGMREFPRRRIAGSKDTGGSRGVSAWASAAHPLRLRTCRLVTGRSHRPRSAWPNQARIALLAVTHRYNRTIFGSNNFRSPNTCWCFRAFVRWFQRTEQPAMVTRRSAACRGHVHFAQVQQSVWDCRELAQS